MKLKPRYIVYSLLACMAAVALWFYSQDRFVQARTQMVEMLRGRANREANGNFFKQYDPEYGHPDMHPMSLPWYRQWLGDTPMWRIYLRKDCSAEEKQRLLDLFPEATVFDYATWYRPPVYK